MSKFNLNTYIKEFFVILSFCLLVSDSVASLKGSRPNIILVLTDDQGMGDLSCMGNPILKTPNIDHFYKQSTRFSDFHVSPTCAPTRAALMSGRRPFEVGVTHTILQRERMSLEVKTFPEVLKDAGYKNGIFGTWHLGDEEAYLPQNRGFDEVLMHGAGGIGQTGLGDFKANEENPYFDNILLHNDTVVRTQGFCTDLFFSAALAWMERQVKIKQPFFSYISLNAPHGPMYAPEKYKKRLLDIGLDPKSAARYGMIENIDDNFGKMMHSLKSWKALDNTLIIFMTDNGMSMAPIKKGKETLMPHNANMKGKKNSPWEGGTHVPSFWYWKGVLKEDVDLPMLTAHIDIYPTFCELAGANLPKGKLAPIGRSLLPLFNNPNSNWKDRHLFIHKGRWDDGRKNKLTREENRYNGCAIRIQDWRLVFNLVKGHVVTELYHISKDPGGHQDVSEQYPEIVQNLKRAYDQWWESLPPFLINENLPSIPSDKHPFALKFDQQEKDRGIPFWSPVK